MMRFMLLPLLSAHLSFCQLKQCWDPAGYPMPDIPCDPTANVSSCCGQTWICATNFYCTSTRSDYRGKWVGSCTDKTWHDPACPLLLNNAPDKFDYAKNTTACDDGTFCPQPDNTTCCFNKQGKSQIKFHYDDPVPSNAAGLSEFYASNGYHILSDTLSTNTLSTFTSASALNTEPFPTFAPISQTEPGTSSSTSGITSQTDHTISPSTSAITSQTQLMTSPSISAITPYVSPSAVPSLSAALPSTDQIASSGLNSSTKAGLGVGVGVGASALGLLLYFSIRWLRRRPRTDLNPTITLRNGSERYEKPELTGQDAVIRGGAELIGDEVGMELDASLGEQRVRYELYT